MDGITHIESGAPDASFLLCRRSLCEGVYRGQIIPRVRPRKSMRALKRTNSNVARDCGCGDSDILGQLP